MRLPMMNDKIIDSDFDGLDLEELVWDDELGEFVPVYNDDLELLGDWETEPYFDESEEN